MRRKDHSTSANHFRRRLYIILFGVMFLTSGKLYAQLPITYYDYELNSNRNVMGESTPEQSINTTGNMTGTSGYGLFTDGAGTFNGGTNVGCCFGNNLFGVTGGIDPKNSAFTTSYFYFASSTVGFTGISISFDCIHPSANSALFGINYSTDGGINWAWLGSEGITAGFPSYSINVWKNSGKIALPVSCENNANLIIYIYGYDRIGMTNVGFYVDNVALFATSTTSSAGSKTLLNENNIYTSLTSGGTASVLARGNFTVTGASTTITIPDGSLLGISGTFAVASGATLNMGGASTGASVMSGTGGFILNSGTTLGITDLSGISNIPSTGNIRSSLTRTYDGGANYVYKAVSGTMATGTALPTNISGSLTINNSGVTLTNATTMASGSTLNLTNGTFSNGSNLSMSAGSNITRDVGTLNSVPTWPSTTPWVNLTYTGTTGVTTGNELPIPTTALGNFTDNKTGTVTLGAGITKANGTVTIGAGATLDVSASNFGITTAGNWVNSGTNFNARSGNVTFGGTSTISGSATNTFYDITISPSSTLTGPSSGTINVKHNLSNSGTFTHNSGTVVFNGTTQDISGANVTSFNTLTIANGSTVTGTKNSLATTANINSGGKYIQKLGSGILGTTENFVSGSTYELQLSDATGFSFVSGNSSFGNLVMNFSGSAGVQAVGFLTTVLNDLDIKNTGSSVFAFAGAQSPTIAVGGNLIIEGGALVGATGSGAPVINVAGNLQVSSGSIKLTTSSGNPALNVTGNATLSGGTFQPNAGSGAPTVAVGSLTLNTGTIIDLGKTALTSNGAISGAGKIAGSSTTSLVLNGGASSINMDQTSPATRSLKDLTLNTGSSATLSDKMDVYGTIALTSATLDLNAKNLTLRSNSAGTARIANLTGSNLNGATNVTMERYIKLRTPGTGDGTGDYGRAYRLLTPTVNTSGSINANWQEGQVVTTIGTPVNTVPNYGTHITGSGGNTNGFDVTQSNAPSLYLTTNGTTLTYTAVGSTSGTLNANTGYFLYLRGDRSMSLQLPTATNMPTSSTTLRATGTVLKGDQTVFANALLPGAGTLNLVTNPYPSPIDWSLVFANATHITNAYTYWDPNLGTRGGFATVNTAGATSTAESGTVGGTKYIQSGQAFFVQSADASTPTLTIKENHKAVGNNNGVFKTTTSLESFRTTLYFTEPSGYRRASDGVIAVFDNSYSAAVDQYDAFEINNWDENIAIARDGKHIAIESRPVIQAKDTIPLFMNNMKQQAYQFEFVPLAFTNTLLKAELIDKFLGTRTLISVVDTAIVSFIITSDPASSVTDRFMVVFTPLSPLAIDVMTIKAYQKNTPSGQAGAQVEWTAKTETDMDHYEVERSFDGVQFNWQ